MNKVLLGIAGVFGFFAISLIVVVAMYFSYSNREIELRTTIQKQQQANEAAFDTMWKILQESGGVADSYKDAFKEIYQEMIKSRYSGADSKNLIMKFVTENNPKFDPRLYIKLQNSIESERHSFLNRQEKLLQLKASHDALLQKSLGPIFLSGRQPIDVTIVTSDNAKEAFKKGVDNGSPLEKKK